MAFRPTIIEGGGKPEPDEEAVSRCEAAVAAIKAAVEAGEPFWVMTGAEEGFQVTYYGDGLELAATVEEVARDQKRFVLGLDE